MCKTLGFLLPAVLAVAPFSSVTAQEATQVEQGQSRSCFRGQPLPTCKSFWITEAGYGYALTSPTQWGGEGRHYATWELGWMTNLTERWAVGGTFLAGIAFGEGTRVGVKPRFRRWLNRSTSVELSPGILLGGSGDVQFPGFTGHVSVNLQDRLVFTSQLDVFNKLPGSVDDKDVAWYAGIKLGSKPGIIATGVEAAATLVLIVAVIIAYSGGS